MINLKYPIGLALISLVLVQTIRLNTAQLALKEEKALAAVALASSTTKAREAELKLSNQAVLTRKETNEAITILAHERNALLKRVRIAEDRTKQLDAVSKAGTVTSYGTAVSGDSTGELLGTVGEEDVEEANRADTIRVSLLACYRQYDEARQALHH